jgi:hypothetical protein
VGEDQKGQAFQFSPSQIEDRDYSGLVQAFFDSIDPFLPSREVKDLAKNIMRCRAGWRAKLAP